MIDTTTPPALRRAYDEAWAALYTAEQMGEQDGDTPLVQAAKQSARNLLHECDRKLGELGEE